MRSQSSLSSLSLLWALALFVGACGKDPPPAGGAGGGGGARGGSGGASAGGKGGNGQGGMPATGGGGTGGGISGSGGVPSDGAPEAAAEVASEVGPSFEVSPEATAEVAAPVGNPFVYVGSSSASEIRIFELDLASGALMARGSAPSGPAPDYLAFHPSGQYLYAVNEVPAGRVVAFSVNPQTGALTMLNSASSGGNGPAHLSVHKSGRWVLTANYGSGHAAALPIAADGRVGAPLARQAGAQAHMIIDDGASGRFVFVPSKGDNRVLQFAFDENTGALTPNDPPFVAESGSPRHMVFHPGGKAAFLLLEAGLGVVSYRYDGTTGRLTEGVRLAAAPMGDGAHIRLHPQRDILYASIRFYDAIAIFSLDANLRPQAPRHVRQQIARPWDFDIDPTGKYMLVANNDNASVQVFRIGDDGGLTRVGSASVPERPRFVGILKRPAP